MISSNSAPSSSPVELGPAELLRALLDPAPWIALRFLPTGELVWANVEGQKWLGQQGEAVLESLRDLVRGAAPDTDPMQIELGTPTRIFRLAAEVDVVHCVAFSRQASVLDALMRDLASWIAPESMDDLLRSVLERLHASLDVDFAVIGETVEGQAIQGLVSTPEGIEPVRYGCEDMPCGEALDAGLCSCPDNVAGNFPNSALIGELRLEGVISQCLHDATGKSIGVIGVMHRAPISDPEHCESVLRLFALRLGPELGRIRAGDLLREHGKLLDHASDAISVWTLDGQLEFWNQGAEKLLGWTLAEAKSQMPQEILALDRIAIVEGYEAVLEHDHWHGELRQRTKDGRELIVESRWTLIRNQQGAPRAVLIINTDQTERRLLDRKLVKADRLEGLATLAGGIAHELNNVLAPIMMSIDLLRRRLPTPEDQELLDALRATVEHGMGMVRQVNWFARGVEGERAPLDPRYLLKELADFCRRTFGGEIEIETKLPMDAPLVVGDASMLYQVLLNLCLNAQDAMSGSGVLKLSVFGTRLDATAAAMRQEAHEGFYTVIEVKDNGRGIAPEHRLRVFEPFFTTKGEGRATGLGLTTVRSVVRSHSGFVDLESTLGQGTTVSCYLPSAKADQRPAPVNRAIRSGQGELILLVDDDKPVREVTRRALEENGYRVVATADGAQAIAEFARRASHVAAVVTDLAMPFMDGLALLRALRQIEPRVKVLVATGRAERVRELASLGEACPPILEKPFGAEALLSALGQLLDG